MADNLILLDLIDDNPFQTRQTYDDAGIAELAADIYARGLLQPPVGRQVDGRVQLAFGHRRLRAYRHIRTQIDAMGWSAMPVNVQTLSDEQMALAKGLAERQIYYGSDKTNFGAVKQAYESRLKNLGLAVPWDVPPEENLRRRYERIERWAINQEWWKWDYETNLEAIAGNQVNLAALAAEAATLGEAAGELPLLIGTLQQQLTELEPVAAEINSRRQTGGNWWGRNEMPRTVCQKLLTLEPGSLLFEKALGEAEAIHARYALIFANGLERIQALCDRRMVLEPEHTGEAFPVL
jgi:hypothetical protein